MNDFLNFVWRYRLRLIARANDFKVEGDTLWKMANACGPLLTAERARLGAEAGSFWSESGRLRCEGDRQWAEAVLLQHGNVTMMWPETDVCRLETGEEFRCESANYHAGVKRE